MSATRTKHLAIAGAEAMRDACEASAASLAMLPAAAEQLAEAASIIANCLAAGGKILFCGNGGSAADSQHLAAELAGRFLLDREPLAAVALTTDTSALTAIANDYGYAEVFARQLRALGRSGDVLVAISTSGNSASVIRAAQAAQDLGIKVIAFTGKGGGDLAEAADLPIRFPAERTDRIQEMHIAAGHIVCGAVEEALCGSEQA